MSNSTRDDDIDERALEERPDDVSGRYETPDQFLDLESGRTVGGRFVVRRFLGSSGGATSYLCEDERSGDRIVLKVVELETSPSFLDNMRTTIREASQIRHPNLTSILGMGETEEGATFVAMEYVEGATLSAALRTCRDDGHVVGLEESFHVLMHLAEALETIHDAETCHGVLTPYHVYLEEGGSLKVSNLGFGRMVAELMRRRDEGGAFTDSIYVAPEIRQSADALGAAADLYSLAMIAGELLAERGLPDDREAAEHRTLAEGESYSGALHHLLEACLEHRPSERLSDTEQFRRSLEGALEAAGVEPNGDLPEGGIPVEPAVGDDEEDDPFDIPSLDTPDQSDDQDDRYLIRRDGLDYGPFTKEEVLEQLYDDEIDEHTEVRDRRTRDKAELGEMEAFVEEVEEYVPVREERKRKERERREEIQRRVKQGGKAVLVAGIIAALGVLAVLGYFYFTRPAPKPVPLEDAIVSMDYEFSPPPTDFQTVSVDEDVLESIFNPNVSDDAIARKVQQARQRGGGAPTDGNGQQGGTGGSEGGGDEGANVVDMSEGSGSEVRLNQRKINNIILSNFDRLRECIQKELASNPSFNGVTVKFYIRPSGTTGGVGLQETQYENKPVGRCLIREFRTMKFPDPKAVTKRGVTFPLEVQR